MAILSYSQNREDVLLNRLFPDGPGGFYVDVGAGDPILHSVTKLFYDRGWHGINIEPIPTVFQALARDRPRDINLPIGLSDHEGMLAFHEFPGAPGFSTFSREQAELHRRAGYEAVEHSIPVTTLARVCEQHDVPTIDFLKIDVESHERQVLEGADWGRYRPRIVVVEATRPATNIPNHEEWEFLLLEADYLFAFFDGLNRYYVRAEERPLIPRLAVPVNIFDEHLVYEHHQHIERLVGELEETRQSLEETRAARDVAQAGFGEAQEALMGMRRALDDSQRAYLGIRAELVDARAQLEAARAQFEAARAQLGAARAESEAARAELEAARAELEATRAELEATRAELEAARAELAPFQELGPIAIGVARRLRRMSIHSPRLATMAKWIIRRAHPRARAFQPDT
jgi:FkbM family methyltransferase